METINFVFSDGSYLLKGDIVVVEFKNRILFFKRKNRRLMVIEDDEENIFRIKYEGASGWNYTIQLISLCSGCKLKCISKKFGHDGAIRSSFKLV